MISEKINQIINEQINKEFYSGYLYLSMSANLHEIGLFGFASWLKIQAKEEVEHGLRLLDYLLERNSYVTLQQIRTPEFEFNGVISVFNTLYEHEKCITNAVMQIAKLAEEECDRQTLSFIDWFIEEQTEEEQQVKSIIKRLEIFGEDKVALYLMDKELAGREA
jgi:ferritin